MQGPNWRVARVDNCPPSFWKFFKAVAVAAARRITTCPPSFRKLLTPLHERKVRLTYRGIFCAAQLDAGFLRWLAQPNFVE